MPLSNNIDSYSAQSANGNAADAVAPLARYVRPMGLLPLLRGGSLALTLTLGLVLTLGLTAGSAWAASEAAPVQGKAKGTVSAKTVVNDSVDALLALIETSREYAKQDSDRFYNEVEALLAPVVDFRVFANGVMGGYYKKADKEQRARFAESFKWSLVRTYALALTEFKDGKVTILDDERPSDNPKRERVKMEIRTASGDVYPVVYSMRRRADSNWRVYNLVVNGVNMGLTFRSQFASAMKGKKYGRDLDQVIAAWSQEIEKVEDQAAKTADAS